MTKLYDVSAVLTNGILDLLTILDEQASGLDATDVLVTLAVPATRLDASAAAPRYGLMRWARSKAQQYHLGGMTQEGTRARLYELAQQLTDEEKSNYLCAYHIVDHVDEDGLVVLDEERVQRYRTGLGAVTRIEYRSIPTPSAPNATPTDVWNEPPVVDFHTYSDAEGRYRADLDITVEQWVFVVRCLTEKARSLLYIMLQEPDYTVSYETMETRYGIHWQSYNALITYIGTKARRIITNRRVIGHDGQPQSINWPCAYLTIGGDGKTTTNALRPELAEAARAYFEANGKPVI